MLTALVERLGKLTRMDEERTQLEMQPFDLSEAAADTVSAFAPAALQPGKTLQSELVPAVCYTGDEAALRQLLALLLDNAVKYCDPGGTIHVALTGGRHPVLTVENSYAAVGTVTLDRLFDRFYRADTARTSGSGFGIGLSIAKAIAEKHHADLSVGSPAPDVIRFRVRF